MAYGNRISFVLSLGIYCYLVFNSAKVCFVQELQLIYASEQNKVNIYFRVLQTHCTQSPPKTKTYF